MKRILVLSPHADDELLGCGGTLLKLKQRGKKYLDEKIFTENNINIEYFHSENKCAILGGST